MTGPLETTALGAFTQEFHESLPAILASLAVAEDRSDATAAREAHRLIHALKGAASMVGLAALGHLLHLAEERLEPSASGREQVRPGTCAALRESLPLFTAYLEAALAGRATAPMAVDLGRTIGLDDGPAAVTAIEGLIEIERREIASQIDTAGEPAEDLTAATPEPSLVFDLIDAAGGALPLLAPIVPGPGATDLDVDLVPPEEIPAELAEVFALESQEHLETIARLTSQLSGSPDRDSIQELRRAVHTLKGAAGVVGFKGAARLAHRMEDLLDRLYEGTAVLTPPAARTLATSSDALHDLIAGTSDASALRARVSRLFAELGALLGEAVPDEAPAEPAVAHVEQIAGPQSTPAGPGPAVERRRGPRDRRGGQALRVPLARLNELIRVVSELVINRSTFEQHHAGLIDQVDELKLSTARLRKVAHRLESDYEVRALGGQATRPAATAGHGFDELEFDRYTEFHLLTRELVETTSDIATIGARIAGAIRDFDGDLTHFGRLTREIQDKTMDFRMVPLETMRTQLERVVRATAESCGKQVELVIEGAAVALDKSLLEQMSDPILHLLRNGIDHGIELPARRAAADKPAHGSITVRARHEGTDVLIEVEDDGAGLDAERIRQTAIAKGYIDENTATTPEGLHALIFEPGFSTAAEVTEVSGRGVGMDVVKAKVARFGGRVTLTSRHGAGTTVSVRVPMTVSMTRILLVRSGGETLGLPLNAVMQIVRPHPSAIGMIGAQRVLTLDGRTYPMRDLADMLGLARTTDARPSQPVLIANLSGRRIALAVDEILNSRDAVVKPLGTHLRRVPKIWGATVLGDGTVVLILNPADLAGEADEVVVTPVSRAPAAAGERDPYTVLIVDDSLSMRHVLSTAIKKAGWVPVPARDGLEALEIVHRSPQRPDLVLLDIEMPRMDGFEFLSTIRSQKANADLPVVMLTSRGSDKHRDKARALGATDYMVKPFQEDALTRNIDRLVKASRRSETRAAS